MRPAGLPVLAAVGVVVALLAPGRAVAHDLIAKVDPAADPIRVVAGYDDDTPAEGAKVTVTAAGGSVVAAGMLDERGAWAFARPGPGTYAIVVESGGHRDEVTLTIPGDAGDATTAGRFRLDKTLGLTLGLGGLLGLTALYTRLRRRADAPGA